MSDVTIHPTPVQNRTASLQFAALILFMLLLTLTLYTFVHESGHAVIGLLFGGKINAFSVNFINLSAHVGIDGTFTPLQGALVSVAGVLLPVMLCMIFIALAPKRSDVALSWFKLIVFICAVNSLLAWIVIPILVMSGRTASDDSVNFLRITYLPPLLVAGLALVVYLACWFLFLRRSGGLRGLLNQFRTLRAAGNQALDLKEPAARRTIRSLAALGVVTASVTIGLTLALPDRGYQPPADYRNAVEVKLSEGPLQDRPIYRFRLDHPASVSIFIGMDQVKGGPMQIRLSGPNGYENVFLDFKDPRAEMSKSSVHPQALPLEKGDYELRATFQRSQGQLRVYIKVE